MLIIICVVKKGMYRTKKASCRGRTANTNVLSTGPLRVGGAERFSRLVATISAVVAIALTIKLKGAAVSPSLNLTTALVVLVVRSVAFLRVHACRGMGKNVSKNKKTH